MSYEDRTHRLCRGSYKSWTVGCLRGRRETEREEEMLKHRHGVRESAAMTVASVGVGVRAYSWRSKLSLSVEWLLSSCSDESDSWPLTRTWSTCMSMIVITLHSYMDEVLVQRRARWHRLDSARKTSSCHQKSTCLLAVMRVCLETGFTFWSERGFTGLRVDRSMLSGRHTLSTARKALQRPQQSVLAEPVP